METDATAGMSDGTGVRQMWCAAGTRKADTKGALAQMVNHTECQKDTGYLTASMLGHMDTRVYFLVWGGVNMAFGAGNQRGQSANQPEAIKAHDEFLMTRIKYHHKCTSCVLKSTNWGGSDNNTN